MNMWSDGTNWYAYFAGAVEVFSTMEEASQWLGAMWDDMIHRRG